MALTDQEIIDILKEKNINLQNYKQALEAQIRQKKMDLFRSRSADKAKLATEIGYLQKQIDRIDSETDTYNQRIQKIEQRIANKAAPKVEEQKPVPKPEAQTAYEPKKEPNKNLKQNPFEEGYYDSNSYLSDTLGWLRDPSKKQDKFSLYLNPEDENKYKETNLNKSSSKEEGKSYPQSEKDILQSMIDDIADVTNYLRIIDKTYSSKNNGILNVLENLKRKQKKSNLTPEFLTSNLPLITADGKPKENSRINILRESDPENTNEKPKVQSIKVRYENKLNKKGKKIPVIDFQKVFENGIDNAVLYRGPMIEPTTDKQLLKINKELFKKIRKAAPNYKWKM